jgi:hypothetical protein
MYKFHAPIVNNSLIQKLLGKAGERWLVIPPLISPEKGPGSIPTIGRTFSKTPKGFS